MQKILNHFNFKILLIFFIFCSTLLLSQDSSVYSVKNGKVTFISTTNKLTFKGVGKSIKGNLNLKDNSINIQVDLEDLRTGIKNRDDHMKENYLETHKYPLAEFRGNVIKYNKSSGEAEALGVLFIHGIEKKNFKIIGKVREENKSLYLN